MNVPFLDRQRRPVTTDYFFDSLDVPVYPLINFPAASLTVTVYDNVPLTVGVPEIVPLADIVRPAGRPTAEKVYGPPTPPEPVIVTGTIGAFRTALMVAQLAEGAGLTVTEQLTVPVLPAASLTVTV